MGRSFTMALLAGCLVAGAAVRAEVPGLGTGDGPDRQVIYEVNVRQFSEAGNLAAVTDELPRLKELGVDIVWLMPIHPIGLENRKGGLGSPYSVRDYRAVNPDLGTLDDLRRLTATAHSLGQIVILDWVANHCAWDNPLVAEHPEWLSQGADGQPVPPVADWSDVVDLDYSVPALREFMIESMAFWLREAQVDGFRCDVAGMVPVDFWAQARPRLDAVKPVFMLAEWEDPALAPWFHMSYGWDQHRAWNAFAKGEADVDHLDSLLRAEEARWPDGHLRMRFVTNHDENSWNGTEDERLGGLVEAFTVLSFTLPGMPLIYNGQEAALNRRLAFFEKDPVTWQCHPRRDLLSGLSRLKHLSPALWSGETGADSYLRLDPGPHGAGVWAFLRLSPAETLLVVVNLGGKDAAVELADPRLAGRWRQWEDGELRKLDGSLQLTLPAGGWSLWRHPTPK
jgi:glycosidase